VASPLLANVYLHYVYDLWFQQWRKRHATGDMIVVRYADDTIVGFQHRRDAERFLSDLKDRLAQFALSLHPEKTRLIEFGAFAAERRKKRGEGKPATFDFLGFTHYCGTRKDGAGFQLGRRTQRKRMRAKLKEITETLRRVRHRPIDEQGQWLGTVIGGYFAYFAVPTNTHMLSAFRAHIPPQRVFGLLGHAGELRPVVADIGHLVRDDQMVLGVRRRDCPAMARASHP